MPIFQKKQRGPGKEETKNSTYPTRESLSNALHAEITSCTHGKISLLAWKRNSNEPPNKCTGLVPTCSRPSLAALTLGRLRVMSPTLPFLPHKCHPKINVHAKIFLCNSSRGGLIIALMARSVPKPTTYTSAITLSNVPIEEPESIRATAGVRPRRRGAESRRALCLYDRRKQGHSQETLTGSKLCRQSDWLVHFWCEEEPRTF